MLVFNPLLIDDISKTKSNMVLNPESSLTIVHRLTDCNLQWIILKIDMSTRFNKAGFFKNSFLTTCFGYSVYNLTRIKCIWQVIFNCSFVNSMPLPLKEDIICVYRFNKTQNELERNNTKSRIKKNPLFYEMFLPWL